MPDRFAASCIAWPADMDAEMARLLAEEGVSEVELVPGRIDPEGDRLSNARSCAQFWEGYGIKVCAMQALLFGAPPYALFGDANTRAAMIDYLSDIIRIGGALGAGALVFGSPKQRIRGQLSLAQAMPIAIETFDALGNVAANEGTKLCIEANPPEYGCDFITTLADAHALVKAVNNPGFGLHIDTAALLMVGENPVEALKAVGEIAHFHISDPELAAVGAKSNMAHHENCARALAAHGYRGPRSIEMRATDNPLTQMQNAIGFVKQHYRTLDRALG